MWRVEPDLVTFIVPTKGRPSLQKALQSLIDLNDWNWKCIVIFDGNKPINLTLNKCSNYLEDNHFTVIRTNSKGHAGLVRNKGLPLVNTRWTAFLDDDDFLAPTYLDKLKHYSNSNPNLDIIIFSYKDVETGNIQPPNSINKLVACNVGISFAIKTDFIHNNNILFTEGGVEDFRFLDECESKGAKYLITHDIQYFVGHRSAWE